ncbi:MAG TPA: glutamine-hydrolyzing carbamoyl-phosphate synthase small subunit [Candidatus Altiarchaeales archaeon]|nr:glutamine-hydrolyzing carbamoyl-phosphate synthase small subunit [Candidatus Altiarchaeales archaeon]
MSDNAVLVLRDGTVLTGMGFGAEGTAEGEVVFNTSMTGYQEALTDPSYKYQILMMTYPLIGNYGINKEDFESKKIHAEGFIIRELAEKPSHGKLTKTLDEFLKDYEIPGVYGVDTRFLTRKIRVYGVMNGILKYPYDRKEIDDIIERVRKLKSISDLDLVSMVTTRRIREYIANGKKTIALIDCGEKHSIIRAILDRKINVIRVPATTKVEKILSYDIDGIVISNGPGDPEKYGYIIKTIRELINEEIPIFGICLGNQLIALACGAKTYKLKFGHRGSNQPVMDIKTRKVYITSQNHGFAVDSETMKDANLEVTHINLNDNSVEGLRHKELSVIAVQYHPEAHPGPWDNYYLFDEFLSIM